MTALAVPPSSHPATAAADLFGNAPRIAWLTGIIGLLLCAGGVFFNPTQFFFSYLVGFVFWTGLSLGCLCVLMIHHLTGGGWGYLIRRFLEAATMVLPVMALLFLPLFFGLHYLYPWTHPLADQELALQKRLAYLNYPFFSVRMVVFFGLWIGAACFLNYWSFAQDRTTNPEPTRRLRTFSGPGLLVFTIVGSLAVVDWLMTTEPVFYSTVFPAQVLIGWILSAFAFCALLLSVVKDKKPWAGLVRTEHFHSLGNFLLAFVMMWAYLAVSQLIVIWSGNLPKEIGWYLHRVAGGWKLVAIFLGLFHFALPFFLLLSREYKEDLRMLRRIAAGILGVHAVEVFWQVEPSLHSSGFSLSWMDLAALAGVGGVWLGVFFHRLASRRLLPQNDPRMEEALAHGH
jgi:hypothetical protein